MKPTLVILAAGMGSRYGGLKQIDALGPGGETIMDFSIYDAILANFGKVVFIIREDFEEDFKQKVMSKYDTKIATECVFQSLDKIPAGCQLNPDREKPWGTAHAMMMAKEVVKENFVVINADDFYGRSAYQTVADYLQNTPVAGTQHSMVGFELQQTTSEHGSVARAIAEANDNNELVSLVERTEIVSERGKYAFIEDGTKTPLPGDSLVSMNMFGFTPTIFENMEAMFKTFVDANYDHIKAEFLIPSVVTDLINAGQASMQVLSSSDKWYGVTYQADKPIVMEAFKRITDDGTYPSPLFG